MFLFNFVPLLFKKIYICTMKQDVSGFFTDFNALDYIDEKEYEVIIDTVVAAVDSTAITTGYGVYVFDYYKKNVFYVSANIRKWCGLEAGEVLETGLDAYLRYIPNDDLAMLYEINDAAFKFWNQLPPDQLHNYVNTYDFRYHDFMVNQRYNPMIIKNGKIWLAMCTVSMSSQHESGNIVMKNVADGTRYEYSRKNKNWIMLPPIVLSEKEKNIIRYSAQGMSSAEIAEVFHVRMETVRSQKKNLFKKLEVNSMSEAIILTNNINLL